ncbi:hypothetical protein SUGI_0704370 [Cryptomeria japonica]|nr:hypothetical protein SUGI_0704370 [Cryptomeria japonica]
MGGRHGQRQNVITHPLRLADSLAIPCEISEWAVRTILGEEWIVANPMASPNLVASRLASMVMDLTQSQDYTKMVVGAFVHPTLVTWEELNLQLEKYDLFSGEVWWGGFGFSPGFSNQFKWNFLDLAARGPMARIICKRLVVPHADRNRFKPFGATPGEFLGDLRPFQEPPSHGSELRVENEFWKKIHNIRCISSSSQL